MAYWQLAAEADGARDSSGHGHDGVINGVARTAPGRDDPTLSHDGRGGSVEVPHESALNGTERALTVEARVKPECAGDLVGKNRRAGCSLYLGESDFRAAIPGASIFGGNLDPWAVVSPRAHRGPRQGAPAGQRDHDRPVRPQPDHRQDHRQRQNQHRADGRCNGCSGRRDR